MIIKVKRVLPQVNKSDYDSLDVICRLVGVKMEDVKADTYIWLDTKYITQIDSVLPDHLSDGAFSVYVIGREQPVYIGVDCYDELLNAWIKEN